MKPSLRNGEGKLDGCEPSSLGSSVAPPVQSRGQVRIRLERFGAIVAMESPSAWVAVDRPFARGLGVDGGQLWDGESPGLGVRSFEAPTEVHVAATARCPAACKSCYADATPSAHEPSFDEVSARLQELADLGVLRVAFGGGEASLREDVIALAERARALGLVVTLTTSGLGVTPSSASAFRVFEQVNVSYDGAGEAYRDIRGYDGALRAEAAARVLVEAGVTVGLNTVVTRRNFSRLRDVAVRGASIGARDVQLLRFKPAGRARAHYTAERLTPAQVEAFPGVVRTLCALKDGPGIRIDCALVPFLVGSGELDLDRLTRLGVLGCEGGHSLMTLDSRGRASPCSFWGTETSSAMSPAEAWQSEASLEGFRAYVARLPAPCSSCAFRAVCRGGCRVVARHLTGTAWAPDPECPRVRKIQ